MSLKTWLLTGTSIGLMAFAPISALAQDAEIQAAYQAYLQAQSSGDAGALEAARANLTELCIVGGYAGFEECLATLAGGGAPPAAEPQAQPEPQPEPEPEPVIEEPQPEPAPEPEPAPTAEEPAPAPEPAPVIEEPAPEPEPEPVIEEPAPEPEPEPAPVAEEPAPAAEEPASEEPAPEAPVEAPAAEQPAAEMPAEQPAAETPAEQPAADYGALLAAQVDLYEAAIADLMAAGDAADAQARIDAARAEIAAICAEAGQPDPTACLAQYGLELPAVPAIEPTPAVPVEEPEADEPVAEEEAPAEQPAPIEETTEDGQAAEPVVELPEGVTPEQIAPVLDSVKDEETAIDAGEEQPAEQETVETAPAEPAAPPPASDQDAQAGFELPEDAAQFTALADEGEAVEVSAVEVAVPQNVTIVNQTNITNNVTNVTNIDNSVTNIGQQNNVQQNILRPATPGEAITQVILQVGTQLIVNSIGQDTDRFYNPQQDEIYYENLRNGRVREVITRPDGTQIVTVRNRNGDILRRSRITPDGHETVLAWFDDRYDRDLVEWRDPGANLPPLRLNIPVRDYVLDARYADEREVETFFAQPPVEQVARIYSIDEVKRSARVRDSVRKLEVGNLTFDTAAATIGRDQVRALSNVANAMLALLERNPNETFLIEGHTDAVGSDISNLRLSDLRAATVARVLTDFYGVPPENLATQGYGERYLKIRTEAAERENRRVTIRRITPLITLARS